VSHSMIRRLVMLGALAALLIPVAAQSGYPALGLSAAPDSYVDEITVEYGSNFTLYVVLMGSDGEALPFDLSTINWALLGSCCGGSPAYYIDTILTSEMTHTGDPTLAISSTAETCVTSDFIMLAEVSFNWIYQPNTTFHLGVANLSAAVDCEDEPWILTGAPLLVIPTGLVPNESDTWSGIKAIYR
jgi:hypothetical protein